MAGEAKGEQPRDVGPKHSLLAAVLMIFVVGLTYRYAVGSAYQAWPDSALLRVLGGWFATGLPAAVVTVLVAVRMSDRWVFRLAVVAGVLWLGLLASVLPPRPSRSGPAGPGDLSYEGGGVHLAGVGWGLLGLVVGVLLLLLVAVRTTPATRHRRPMLLAAFTGPVVGALVVAMLRAGVGGS